MKNILTVLAMAGAFRCVSAEGSSTTTAPQQYIKHTVKKGETVSLLCIELYGEYRPQMAPELLKLNPNISDINLIRVGQILIFPNPSYRLEKEEPVLKTAAAVFESRLNATQGVVTYVEGNAMLFVKGTGGGANLAPNTIVNPGDTIQTGANGRVEILVNRESVVRLRENSRLAIEAFRDMSSQKGLTRMHFVGAGAVWSKVKKMARGAVRFQLELPTVSAGVHGTTYQATVHGDSSSEVLVYDGKVELCGRKSKGAQGRQTEPVEVSGPEEVAGPHEVSMEQWTQIVRAMQRVTIDKNGNPCPPKLFVKNRNDEWIRWNEERDRRIERIFEEGI